MFAHGRSCSCIFFLLLASTLYSGENTLKSNQAEEKPLTGPGQGVQVSATIKDSSFRDAQVSGPAFSITLTIQNFHARAVELGESLVLLEQERGASNAVACYQSRARETESPRLQRFMERYQLAWGQEIDKKGDSLMMFVGGGHFSVSFAHPGAYEGLGFGKVSAKSERTIEIELPFPYKLKGEREALVLIAPAIRTQAGTTSSSAETVMRFEPKPAADRGPYRLVAADTIHLSEADLRQRLAAPSLPVWERLTLLNWFAETAPKSAEPLLLEAAGQKDAPVALRTSAVYALGLTKSVTAVPKLIEMTSSETETPLRRAILIALGDIGDVTAAPSVRAMLSTSDETVSSAAMQAAGKLKDPDAVSPLATLFKTSKRGREAAEALAAIATPDARQVLIAGLHDSNADVRDTAIAQLGETGWPEAAPPLAAVVRDPKVKDNERTKAISALGKLGGPQALTVIKESLSDSNEKLYDAALSALGKLPPAEIDAAVLNALTSRHSNIRRQAAVMLEERQLASAVPALWAAYQKETEENTGERMADALAKLKFADRSTIPWLLSRLDPKKNKLWYSDIVLLKQLTAQDFGPKYRWVDNKERDAAIAKWTDWGREAPVGQ